MSVDPTIVQLAAENVRAEVLARPGAFKLDSTIVRKIREKVPIFSGMTPACLLQTLSLAESCSIKAGELVFNEGDIGDSFFVLIDGDMLVEKSSPGRAVE